MGRPPSNGAPSFRFNHTEVAQMETILREHEGQVPTREYLEALAEKFSNAPERAGKVTVQMKQAWNWFQNRRYALRSKLVKSPGKLHLSPPMPREEVAPVRNVPHARQQIPVSSGHNIVRSSSENCQMEFEAKSARDGAWYDVQAFLSHRYLETGNPEVLVRFVGFGAEEDEWINVRKHARPRSLPCESSECVAVIATDLILCFQEGKEQALYFDAHVLDAQRRRHDIRGCRCRFLVRYDHDQSEEIVPLRKICRRPETDHRLQILHAANEAAAAAAAASASEPVPFVLPTQQKPAVVVATDPSSTSSACLRVTNPNPTLMTAISPPPPPLPKNNISPPVGPPEPSPLPPVGPTEPSPLPTVGPIDPSPLPPVGPSAPCPLVTPTALSPFPHVGPAASSPFASVDPTAPSSFPPVGPSAPCPLVAPTAPSPFPHAGPSASSPVASVDPSAPSPFTHVGPAASSPFVSVDPTAPSPFASVDPTVPSPFAPVDPTAPSPFPRVGPAASSPFVSVDPTVPSPFPSVDPTALSTPIPTLIPVAVSDTVPVSTLPEPSLQIMVSIPETSMDQNDTPPGFPPHECASQKNVTCPTEEARKDDGVNELSNPQLEQVMSDSPKAIAAILDEPEKSESGSNSGHPELAQVASDSPKVTAAMPDEPEKSESGNNSGHPELQGASETLPTEDIKE